MNKKLENLFANPALLAKRLLWIAVIIFMCVYVFFQLSPKEGTSFETESALAITIDKTMDVQGYIFRSEQLISGKVSSTVTCVAKEGQRVSPGDHVANAYQKSLDVEAGSKIEDMERALQVLEKSNTGASLVISDISKIDSKTRELFIDICRGITQNSLSDTSSKKDNLLVYLNKRAIASHAVENYNDEIKKLEQQINTLGQSIAGSASKITAPCAGYFYNNVDGCENYFDPKLIDNMTVDEFSALINKTPDTALVSDSAGKIITNFTWYIATKLPKKQAADYEQGKHYTVGFPHSMDKEFTLLLYRKIEETDRDECVLVFKTNIMPEGFSYSRSQKIKLINNRYTGLKVKKKALRIDKETGKKGVYVLVGDIVEFRLVEEIYEFDDYYLISMDDKAYAFEQDKQQNAQKNYSKLKLYDNVILYGKDLYDGKIIGR